MTRGRYAPFFIAGVMLVRRRARRPPDRRGGRPAGAARPPGPRARLRPGRPVRAARLREDRLSDAAKRVSAAKPDTEARGETFYPGPERGAPGRLPAQGAVGRLGRARLPGLAASGSRSARRSSPPPVSTASRPAGCWPTSTRRPSQVRKFEGNPEHPGSRGRNCAKGPATLNQVTDPDRVLTPMRRVGPRGSGPVRAGLAGTRRSTTSPPASARPSPRAAPTRSCTTWAAPARTATPSGCMASWGVDGHNSHTNVCSSGARAGYHLWTGIDRPSPDHAKARVIYLISSHLETGHYFNPHAQRIMEAKANGAKVIVLDTRLSNTATHADWWLSPYPGSRGRHQPGGGAPPDRHQGLRPRVRAPVVELGGVPGRRAPRRRPALSRRSRRSWPACTPSSPSTTRRPSRASTPETIAEVAALRGHAGHRLLQPQLALGGGGEPGRLAGVPHAVPPPRPPRGGVHAGRPVAQRLEQVRAQADPHPAAPAAVERADLAGGVPPRPQRSRRSGGSLGSSTPRGVRLHCGQRPPATGRLRWCPVQRGRPALPLSSCPYRSVPPYGPGAGQHNAPPDPYRN